MKKILIVDDEIDLLKATAFRLEKSGYAILNAVNGQEAIDLAKREKPDLILLDLRIPIISGSEVCKILKEDDQMKHIPIIIFTASTSSCILDKSKEAGADDCITKPFDAVELLAKIKKFLK